MKRIMKTVATAIATTVTALTLTSCSLSASAMGSVNGGYQPEWALHCQARAAIVQSCVPTTEYDVNDELIYVVTAKDCEGLLWQFDTTDPSWTCGDGVNMILYDNGTTDTILDDIVVNATYERYDLL